MRALLLSYYMETPIDLAAALGRMAKEPGVWKPFAGGTDLMVCSKPESFRTKSF